LIAVVLTGEKKTVVIILSQKKSPAKVVEFGKLTFFIPENFIMIIIQLKLTTQL
jgi:hypothetical protein